MDLRFPLTLSCGHKTDSFGYEMCSCSETVRRTYQSDGDSPIDRALHDFNGKWRETLESYGAQLPNSRRHGPCPVCGGKDRFRFDDKNGRGTWFCSQCPEESGGGLKLLSMYIGKSTMETAKELVGEDDYRSVAPKREVKVVDYDVVRLANIERAKKGAALLMRIAVSGQHQYMINKGFNDSYLVNGQDMSGREGITKAGELLLIPVHKKGELVNVQKITNDGEKKPITGGDMQGVYHAIDGGVDTVAIAEGYATSITINKLTANKVYCSFNTGNLKAAVKQAKADHPNAKLVIYADHDKLDPTHNRCPGEYYANEAALVGGAFISMPPELGDWDDYRQKHGNDKCIKAMDEALLKDEQRHMPKEEPKKEVDLVALAEAMPSFGSWIKNPNESAEVKPVEVKLVEVAQEIKPTPKPKRPKLTGSPKDIDILPHGITFEGIDIDNPPGVAGEIVDYIRQGAHRRLTGGAYSIYALQTLAMAGYGLTGFAGSKLSLITITLGLSAGGKERPQEVMRELLGQVGTAVYGDIRSDKDILRAAVYDKGRCFYVYDEAHKLLSSAAAKSNPGAEQMIAALMSIATTKKLNLSKLHRGEFATASLMAISRFEKTLAAKQDMKLGYNQDREQPKIKAIEIEIEKVEAQIEEQRKMLEMIENGIDNPSLNLAAASTPQKIADMINEDNIEQGFLGRSLIVDCGEEREQKHTSLRERVTQRKNNSAAVLKAKLNAEIGMISQLAEDGSKQSVENEFNGIKTEVTATEAAFDLMCAIDSHYEEHEYLNHPRLGALYARLSERVISVASILALGNFSGGRMTIEPNHVRFALLVTLSSLKHLASNLKVNEAKDGATIEAKLEGIKAKILSRLDVAEDDERDGWRYTSTIKDYLKRQAYYQSVSEELRQHNQDAFENAIVALRGEARVETNGKKIRLIRE